MTTQDTLITNYKKRISETHLKEELFKWERVFQYKGRPDTDAEDFLEDLKTINFDNLVYPMALAVIYHLTEEYPEQIRQLFENLYDETLDITERVKSFNKETLVLYRILEKKLSHHQDERSISTYLSFYNSEKYTFYKSSFYKKYCKLLGIKTAKKNEKYTHYLELIDELIENYIKPDKELIQLVQSIIPDYYNGTNHKILAQDILFQMLDKKPNINYWIFQGNPKVFDFETAFRKDLITTWTASSHKDKIKKGDKVILWLTGNNSGCYGLAEITSEPHLIKSSPDDHLWKVEDKNEIKAGIKITHNLVTNPMSKQIIDNIDALSKLKVGNQGTNFSATEEEYKILLALAKKMKSKRYWLFAPGENATKWKEFYSSGIMGIGWDELGDLKQYKNKKEIVSKLQELESTTSSKSNDATANYEFLNVLSIGDIIIPKKGRKEFLGYGIVTSDYYYDPKRESYQKCRKVEWKKKGTWIEEKGDIVTKTLTDITKYPDYVEKLKKLIGIEQKEVFNENNKKNMHFPLNTILYGPPGTGKTYNTVLRAAEIIENRKIDSFDEALKIFNQNLHDRIEFITFHQNYSYEDFIQGLRPDTENNKELTFERKDGVFKSIADKALKNIIESELPLIAKKPFEEVFNQYIEPIIEGEIEEIEVQMKKVSYFITGITNKSIDFRKASGGLDHTLSIATLKKMYNAESVLEIQGLSSYYRPLLDNLLKIGKDSKGRKNKVARQNYVIIIDEINRANISRVFGELITLIEPDKRSHGLIPMEARLPSGDTFIVPSNLYLIGTMNTADKSIALLDIALRRRFEFESMYPQYEIKGEEIYDTDILQKINNQIIKTKGHDFQIGHAYFMGDNKDLLNRMNKKVIPLLLEYYMNDKKEVESILNSAGLTIEKDSWPLKITGKND